MNIDIVEGNKIIAEFMGAEWVEDDYGDWGYKHHLFPSHFKYWAAAALKYHSSWDWLMPAWKKFYDEVVLDQDINYTPEYGKDLECMEYSLESANIIGAFKHFVNLLNWYNKNK